ncbi:hypothetical protein AAMO2058_001357700 [Amorphochlora amoebiformis]
MMGTLSSLLLLLMCMGPVLLIVGALLYFNYYGWPMDLDTFLKRVIDEKLAEKGYVRKSTLESLPTTPRKSSENKLRFQSKNRYIIELKKRHSLREKAKEPKEPVFTEETKEPKEPDWTAGTKEIRFSELSTWSCNGVAAFIRGLGKEEVWKAYAIKGFNFPIDGPTLKHLLIHDLQDAGFKRIHARVVIAGVKKRLAKLYTGPLELSSETPSPTPHIAIKDQKDTMNSSFESKRRDDEEGMKISFESQETKTETKNMGLESTETKTEGNNVVIEPPKQVEDAPPSLLSSNPDLSVNFPGEERSPSSNKPSPPTTARFRVRIGRKARQAHPKGNIKGKSTVKSRLLKSASRRNNEVISSPTDEKKEDEMLYHSTKTNRNGVLGESSATLDVLKSGKSERNMKLRSDRGSIASAARSVAESVMSMSLPIGIAAQSEHFKPDMGPTAHLLMHFMQECERRTPTTLGEMIRLRYEVLQDEKKLNTELEDHIPTRDDATEVPDDRATVVEDSSDDDEPKKPNDYKLRKHHGSFIGRFLKVGKGLDKDAVMSWSDKPIQKSLLKVNRKYDDLMIWMFKSIRSFMGDRRSAKAASEKAQKMIRSALLSKQSCRDEVFLQIIKQTTKHPDQNKCAEGWSLMLLSLMSFSPSIYILEDLNEHIQRTINSGTVSESARERAELCRMAMEIIRTAGVRREAPPTAEIEDARLLFLTDVQIYIPGEKKGSNIEAMCIRVDPFMTVLEAETMVAHRLGIDFAVAFGLFEANDFEDKGLNASDRIMDVISSWEDSIDCELRALAGVKNMRGASNDEKKRLLKKRKKQLEDIDPRPKFRYLLLQGKMLAPVNGPLRSDDILEDTVGLNLIYNQAKRDFLQGRFSVNEKDVAKLAALKLQVDYDNDSFDKTEILNKDFDIYFPDGTLGDKPDSSKSKELKAALVNRTLKKYTKLIGMPARDAKISFIAYSERSDFWGAQMFRLQQRKQLRSLPDFFRLVVTMNGVFFENPESGELTNKYEFKDLVTWGYSSTKFVLVVGDVVQQKKFVFRTVHGRLIRNLIHCYVQFEVYRVAHTKDDEKEDDFSVAGSTVGFSNGLPSKSKPQDLRDRLGIKQVGRKDRKIANGLLDTIAIRE